MEKIWWQDLLEGYNRIKKTSHQTVAAMLTSLYAKEQTLIKAGEILGPSSQTIQSKMERLGIPRLPKGHRGMPKCLRAIYDLENTADLTYPEIAKAINFSASRVYFLLHKHGIFYRRKRKEK